MSEIFNIERKIIIYILKLQNFRYFILTIGIYSRIYRELIFVMKNMIEMITISILVILVDRYEYILRLVMQSGLTTIHVYNCF